MYKINGHDNIKNFGDYHFVWAIYEPVKIQEPQEELLVVLRQLEQQIKQELRIEDVPSQPGVKHSRQAFKSIGVDPARYRPSQEALLRRTLKNKPIQPVNTGVDVNNLLSLKYIVPMGLYDVGQIRGEVTIKVGEPGEHYAALNGRDIDCSGKWIIRDDMGPFGSPFVDSKRTAVQLDTQKILHVLYFVHEGITEAHLNECQSVMDEYLHAESEGYNAI